MLYAVNVALSRTETSILILRRPLLDDTSEILSRNEPTRILRCS